MAKIIDEVKQKKSNGFGEELKISVVIPALNEERYISALFESLERQRTKHDFEVIVADGYSTDKTISIAKKFGAHVVKEKNRSAAWERSAGARVARNGILAFVDADTIVPDDWIEKIGDEFRNDMKLVMVYGTADMVGYSKFQNFFITLAANIFLSITPFLGVHNAPGFNMAIRKETYDACGGFNVKLRTAEDVDLAKRAEKFGKLKFCPHIKVSISPRRVDKWGILYYTFFHLKNFFKFLLFKRTSEKYEDIRI